MKLCKDCKIEKPMIDFYVDYRDGSARNICKKCNSIYAMRPERKIYRKQYYQKNKSHLKDKELRFKYNISLEDYNTFLRKQKNCCAICFVHKSTQVKGLVVDHCHKTLTVRGLLCGNCNNGLGRFKDSIASLQNAVLYLNSSKVNKIDE